MLTALFTLLLLCAWGSNLLSLPGNWITIVLILIWKWCYPAMEADLLFFALLGLVAGIGELLEFFSQSVSVKKYGGSGKGSWGALAGAFVGAIVGAPFFIGLGAIPGSIAGAFLGSLFMELASQKQLSQALAAAKGAMFGRIFGIVAKASLGMLILALSIPRL